MIAWKSRAPKEAPEQFAEFLNADIKAISEVIAQSGIELQSPPSLTDNSARLPMLSDV